MRDVKQAVEMTAGEFLKHLTTDPAEGCMSRMCSEHTEGVMLLVQAEGSEDQALAWVTRQKFEEIVSQVGPISLTTLAVEKPKSYAPWQLRAVAEGRDLGLKIRALESFLELQTGREEPEVEKADLLLLMAQLDSMRTYARILSIRIDGFAQKMREDS